MIAQKKISLVSIAVCLGIMFTLAAIGGSITQLGPWYQSLKMPSWQPPGAAFGIVWSTIYVLTTISAVLAWRDVSKPGEGRKLIGLFLLNCVLNLMWSFLFFKLQRPDFAMIQVIFFWLSILALILFIWPINKIASILLWPYLIWVTIASALNLSIMQLNGYLP